MFSTETGLLKTVIQTADFIQNDQTKMKVKSNF